MQNGCLLSLSSRNNKASQYSRIVANFGHYCPSGPPTEWCRRAPSPAHVPTCPGAALRALTSTRNSLHAGRSLAEPRRPHGLWIGARPCLFRCVIMAIRLAKIHTSRARPQAAGGCGPNQRSCPRAGGSRARWTSPERSRSFRTSSLRGRQDLAGSAAVRRGRRFGRREPLQGLLQRLQGIDPQRREG